MSSGQMLILMALSSFLVLPGEPFQTPKPPSAADLLVADEVDKAEAFLSTQTRSAETIALQGEVAFRRGDFAKADTLYKEALRMDDKSARAHFGIGKLALTKLKARDAVREIARAIALSPAEALYRYHASEAYGTNKQYAEQTKQLQEYVRLNPVNDQERVLEAKAALEMIASFNGQDIALVVAPASPAPIPLTKTLNLLFAKVMIDGKGPYNFAIDSGATQVVLSERLATRLGLTPVTTTLMHGVGGAGKVESKLYKVGEISIGDVRVKNVPLGTFNDPLISQLADGILGTAVLSDFIVTIDYPNNRMELTKKAAAATPTTDTLSARYFSNLMLVPLEVNGKFRGNFIVDTGAVTTVLSHSTAALLGVKPDTPGARIELGVAGVGGVEGVVLRVPSVTLKTPKNSDTFAQLVSIDMKEISKMIGTEVSGILGFDFLENYKLVIDYYGAEVRLVK